MLFNTAVLFIAIGALQYSSGRGYFDGRHERRDIDDVVDEKGYRDFEKALYGFKDFVTTVAFRNADDYEHYGNWCGKTGQGPILDKIDACCQQHDTCYRLAKKYSCNKEKDIVKFNMKYGYSITGKYLACEGNSFAKGDVPSVSWYCARSICLCDANAARCFAKYPGLQKRYRKDPNIVTTRSNTSPSIIPTVNSSVTEENDEKNWIN